MSALVAAVAAVRLRTSRRRNGSLRLGLGLLVGLAAASVICSFVCAAPMQQDLGNMYGRPFTLAHPMGTDPLGRDILAWVASGIITGLEISCAVVSLSALVGVTIGIAAGYAGGIVDAFLMRLVDLQLAIPPLLLFIGASAVVQTSMWSLIVLLSVVGWVPYARVVRARVLSERERAYVAASRLAGARLGRLLFVSLLPATVTQIAVLASLQAGLVLLWETGLSFLGLGLQPPIVSLGFMIAQGRADLVQAWWIVTFPGLAIVALVLAFNLLGDGIRDAFNLDVSILGR